eukprot:CAMPEP_0118642088 /NCGR_PEP_ID=MMETSP0785-20121206/5653_1 /TAXON_ID=91992 /ORGANISM="Bolidomonas pacifica, Strain CCMP 1866" /LENGTH=60 /DNA_ID=CAMNT_0006533625 /DNA_START=153 /DNA_END=335 /DNA_ORIENTATION=+
MSRLSGTHSTARASITLASSLFSSSMASLQSFTLLGTASIPRRRTVFLPVTVDSISAAFK